MKKTTVIVVLVLLAAVSAFAQTAADFKVTMNAAGDGVVIAGYPGKAAVVTIPAKIEGLPVVEIGMYAFGENDTITRVVIPAGVTKIGKNAFSTCRKLASITIPEGVTEIGECAFSMTALTAVTLPKSLTLIANSTFEYCRALKTVVIPEGVTEIGGHAFSELFRADIRHSAVHYQRIRRRRFWLLWRPGYGYYPRFGGDNRIFLAV